jgi:hypothetical protein
MSSKNIAIKLVVAAFIASGALVLAAASQAAIFQHPSSISTPSANQIAAWWDITGLYLNINGQPLYFGEYAQSGDAGIVFPGSTWEAKINGQVVGHGYGRVSGRFYNWACQKFGGC